MLTFVARRLVAAFFILLGATFIAFELVANAGDPLESARSLPNPDLRAQTIASISSNLHLDVNPVARYFIWLKGIAGCFVGRCDFGQTINQTPVNGMLSSAILVSLRLIVASTIIAIFLGIAIGIVTALRQYSGFDYSVTIMVFLFFSLPVFWIGVILKDLLAIRFNSFLQAGGAMSWAAIIGISVVMGIIAYSVFGGEFRRRLLTGAVVAGLFFIGLYYVTVTHWLLNPSLGPVIITVLGVLLALGMTELTSGLSNRKSLYTALTTVAVGVILWWPLQYFFYSGMNFLKLFILLLIAIAVGIGIGYLWGGDGRGLSARNGALTAVGVGFVIFVDRIMRAWHTYMTTPGINGRPIKTNLPNTPNLHGDFWIQTTDTLTHLALPTITLMLISLATHSRFARASMLEVLNQDYIRTARSKGLSERTVIMRHAFRNALIPMATVIAFDIAALLGGAVFTETVFGWKALGAMFQNGLSQHDPNPVMAFFVVSATVAVLANLLADLAYAALDPRIRV